MTKLLIDNQELDLSKLNKYIINSSTEIQHVFKEVKPFVDLVVTSPPYFDAKVYSNTENQTGYKQTYEEYLEDIKQTFKGVYKICKPTASLYLNIDTLIRDGKMLNIQFDIINILKNIGWIHRDIIIWDKVKTLPYGKKGQMRNQFEYILFFTKQEGNDFIYNIDSIRTVEPMHWWVQHPEKYSPKGIAPSNIWEFAIPPQGSWGSKVKNEKEILKHVCPFPPEMMARIIKLSSNEEDVVFDPYAGTGILLAVADRLNRKFLGFDIAEESRDIFYNATQKFVDSRWGEIEAYYKVHEYLKRLYEDTIINLRILKYSKMIIKKLKENNEVELFKSIVGIYAKRETLTEKEADKKYCKATFKVVLKDINIKNEIRAFINSIICKAPFSKYSLIPLIDIVSIDDFEGSIDGTDENFYLYENGDFTNYSKEKKGIKEVISYISEEQLEMNLISNNKVEGNPIIISKIKCHEEGYKLLLEFTKNAEKERKYAKIVKKYNL